MQNFYDLNSDSATQTARNINEVWDQGHFNEFIEQSWFQRFCHGEFTLEYKEGSRWLSTNDNDVPKALVGVNPCTIIWKLKGELDVSIGIISQHLNWIKSLKNKYQTN